MISFFRKLRHNFVEQGKVKKYIIYALGEIVLVVIGILIALQVNNHSNKNNQLKKEIIYLKEIEKSLNLDLQNEIYGALDHINLQMDFYDSYLSEISKYPHGVSKDSINTLITRWIIPWDLQINTVAFDNLNSIGIDLISNNELRTELSYLYGYEIPMAISHNKNHTEWNKLNIYPMLHDNINMYNAQITDDQIAFLKSDLQTLNRFEAHHSFWMKGLIFRLHNLIPKAETALKNIRTEILKLENR